MVHSYSLPALPIMIQVQVASERPIYLSKELLCSRSHYFSRALEGDFEESRSYTVLIPWNSHATSCVLFLSWLGSMDLTGDEREKRELERSEDFFNMREAVLMQFQRNMKMGVFLSTREFISVAGLQSLTCRYPVAANCIPFDWFIGKMRQGSFKF